MKTCGCVEKIEKLILEKVKEQNKDVKGYNIEHCFFENASILDNDTTYSTVIYYENHLQKNGLASKTKTHKQIIIHTYCPFCGEKLRND